MAATPAFGELLRRYRRAAGLSQAALAARAGLSTATVAALERGRRKSPTPGTVERLIQALELGPLERARLTVELDPDRSYRWQPHQELDWETRRAADQSFTGFWLAYQILRDM